MRILHVISGLDTRAGGVVAAVLGLAPAQARAGLDVSVISSGAAGDSADAAKALEQSGVKVQRVGPTRGKLARHPDLRQRVSAAVGDAEIVHIHALWEEIQHQAARAAQRLGRPYVFSPHGMLDPWSLRQNALIKRLYLAWRLRRDLNRAAAIHYTAEIERQLVLPMGLKPPGVVVANGLLLEEFDQLPPAGTFRARYPAIGGRRIVLFMSRLHRKKGLDLLIPAFARAQLADAVLVIAGPDADGYEQEVRQMARASGIEDRTIFTGMLRGPERVAALADADLFVLPSYQENFGIVVVEALAAACPVVISDQVNIHREITASGTGGVVPLDIGQLTAEIRRWMNDPALRASARAAARKFVWSNYDWNAIAQQWVGIYGDLITARSPQLEHSLISPLRRSPAASGSLVERDKA